MQHFDLMASVFPRFDQSTLPVIPAGWEDVSWGNDTCPSFAIGESIVVHIDYLNHAERDEPNDYPRFSICFDSDSNRAVWRSSNDWNAVLDMVEYGAESIGFEQTRDREGNDMIRASVCRNGAIIDERDFYDMASAESWLAECYPNAKED